MRAPPIPEAALAEAVVAASLLWVAPLVQQLLWWLPVVVEAVVLVNTTGYLKAGPESSVHLAPVLAVVPSEWAAAAVVLADLLEPLVLTVAMVLEVQVFKTAVPAVQEGHTSVLVAVLQAQMEDLVVVVVTVVAVAAILEERAEGNPTAVTVRVEVHSFSELQQLL
ncbi:hypothetical protein LFE_2268 [Leptospirillum ferrooxidans C2-3]|uniref:Uncharacterized protein n=1 Tax=Leptospirillum ferrooxidans (strain C2-3) TaxID=1162668 RepID=I0IRP1_LEPFC|nr:hypothetical protein LFE_2268 [Leptospirillum ferrooxidans C2-3]